MITISELQAGLTRVQQAVGDVEVKLKHAETEAYTEVKDFLIALSASTGSTASSVTISHGEPDSNAPSDPAPADPAPADQPDVIATAQ